MTNYEKNRLLSLADATGAKWSLPLRALLGAALGTVPLLVSLGMSPAHRSPYLLAYPVVILSAWLLGLPGSIACAAVSGSAIEHYIFSTRQVALDPSPTGWQAREVVFLAGSILVGFLTQRAAVQRERIATARLEAQTARAEAGRSIAEEKERAAELVLENEVRAHMALDGANAGLWEWDIRSNTSKWSAGFYRLHGLEVGGPANYEIWRSCIHPEDVERVEADVTGAVEKVGHFSTDYRVLQPNGTISWIICEANTVAGDDGLASMMRGYCGDITRRKRADLALLQAEKLALAGRLSATIAHEINNPLDAALNLLHLAKESATSPEQLDYLDVATSQLMRICQISQQTLSLSRTAAPMIVCTPLAMVEQTLNLLGPKLRSASIEVKLDVQSNSDFRCASNEVQQILTNIINNAIDAMESHGVLRIRILDSTDWTSRKRRGCRITIGDTGAGMTPEILRSIFEPFFTTKELNGTGLGM